MLNLSKHKVHLRCKLKRGPWLAITKNPVIAIECKYKCGCEMLMLHSA